MIEINGDQPENLAPKQELETEENIKVHLVNLDCNLADTLSELAK
jgi:hypothetical protein